jgi:parallel beta-helix repeat protein
LRALSKGKSTRRQFGKIQEKKGNILEIEGESSLTNIFYRGRLIFDMGKGISLFRKTVSAIMLALLVMSTLTLAFKIQRATAQLGTIIVPDDYPTIREAINAANDGDTIFVRNGIYYENVVVDKSLSLVGENKEATVIDGKGEYVDIVSVAANNVEVEGFTLRNCSIDYGLYVGNSENCTIENNNFVDIDGYGICTVNADYCSIEANSFASSEGEWGRGMQLRYSNNCTIISNQIMTHNDQSCIWLHNSNSCRIYENTLTNAPDNDGLMIEGSIDCIVKKNVISNCGRGIELGWWVGGEFAENSITSNYYGVDAEGFLSQYPGYPTWIFYHNNFINNTSPYRSVYVSSGNGSWNSGYPSGGNYWGDYNGTDSYSGPYQNVTGSDGIGDVPYVIELSNLDNYPLMFPWTPPNLVGDLNGDGKVSLADLQLLASAYNSKPGDPDWNPNADLAPPYGIISLTDLVTLAMHYGQHNP